MFTRHQASIAGLVFVLGLSAAACATAPPQSSTMKLGAMTVAPEGFVAFCRRMPTECVGEGADPEVARQTVEQAAALRQVEVYRQYWTNLFGLSKVADEGATASTEGDASQARPLANAGGVRNVAADVADVATDAAFVAPPAESKRAIALDAAIWTKLNKVNSRINRAIERSSDLDGYGVAELWSLPLEEGFKKGDCEDYALEKRRALVADGVPSDSLSIAVAETSWGERHAVLVVSTDKGDYILDNLTPWIVPWAETTYRWKSRQTSASLFNWATISAS